MTLKLEGGLDSLKMYPHTENEADGSTSLKAFKTIVVANVIDVIYSLLCKVLCAEKVIYLFQK